MRKAQPGKRLTKNTMQCCEDKTQETGVRTDEGKSDTLKKTSEGSGYVRQGKNRFEAGKASPCKLNFSPGGKWPWVP